MSRPALTPGAGAGTVAGDTGWGAEEISVSYGETRALAHVSLWAPAGQLTAVVGGDGAGKTTLLRCLAGVLAPGSGRVDAPSAARLGYLSAGSGTYPDLTVTENLAFRATAYGLAPGRARERAAELLDRAGLADMRGRLAGQLSGGMRQKLGVIAAMMHQPDLLILDEPTTGVDPVSRSGLWALMARAAAAGAAVVLATSYLDEAQRAASVLVLDEGERLAAGTPDEIIAALPGTVLGATERPAGLAGQRAWRRGGRWRVWVPPGESQPSGEPISPDLQDAVTVAALARELARATARAPEADGAATGSGQTGSAQTGSAATGGRRNRDLAGPRPGEPIAQCLGVTRQFGQFTAVREVTLQVAPGEIVGLLGANGAGKTTLIRMLLGLLATTSGDVVLFGQPPSRDTRRRLGYVPQGLGLYSDLTVTQNLEFSAAVFGGAPAELTGQLRAFGDAQVGQLPLGLQRRAAFTEALSHHPDLLILDEPTSGVDPLGRARLWDTIRAAADAGAGVLVTTHYMEEAGECGRLVIMADGRVVAQGTAAQIIGGRQVTVVEPDSWPEAFRALEEAGLPAALAGHGLRVPAADLDTVRRALGAHAARLSRAPATLEERFFELVLPAGDIARERA
ncbi:MAG: ATP-binding cassette domain-containing protein [Streptosporangiaceae bacterium]